MDGLNTSAIKITHQNLGDSTGGFSFTNVFTTITDHSPENYGTLIECNGWLQDSESQVSVQFYNWEVNSDTINPRLFTARGIDNFNVYTLDANCMPVISVEQVGYVSINGIYINGTESIYSINPNGPGAYLGSFDISYWVQCNFSHLEITGFEQGQDIRYLINAVQQTPPSYLGVSSQYFMVDDVNLE